MFSQTVPTNRDQKEKKCMKEVRVPPKANYKKSAHLRIKIGMPLPGLARPKHGAAATFFDRSIQLRAARLLEICRRIMKSRPSNAEMAFMVLDCRSLLHIPPSFPPSGVGLLCNLMILHRSPLYAAH
jgi:hypothetical protein